MKKKLLELLYMCSKSILYSLVLQMFLATILLAEKGAAQSVKEVTISIEAEEAGVEEIFSLVETKTSFRFFFENKHIDKAVLFSFQKEKITVNDLLIEISKKTNLSFKQVNNTIIATLAEERKNKKNPEVKIVLQDRLITGTVSSVDNELLPGVNVVIKGTTEGVITDINGSYSISVPSENSVLVFSYVGFITEEVVVGPRAKLDIVLIPDIRSLEEVVIVGYGEQKKASVVGAITQTTSEVLERAGGVSSLGAALTGNLPGVVTYSSSGMPGAEDPRIIIRTVSSWNNTEPLVLVDGIERPLNTIDISTVESISVLKDASATAVYGVKGANGVILVTTKRGKEGRANIQIRSNVTAKVVSKLPEKYDAYDALMLRNIAIERELGLQPGAWGTYKPVEIIDKYRNPASNEEWDQYPNVDWEDELFKDYAMSYNTSVSVSGGSEFAKYFTSIDFLNEGDMFKTIQNGRGYKAGYGYNRINARTNLDFDLTNTTRFSANLFGSNGTRQIPWDARDDDNAYWVSAYRTAPDAMRPIYSDGTWGYYAPREADVQNSLYNIAMSGVEKRTATQINTDFTLSQSLDMLLKGLSLKGTFAMDNSFRERRRGINDQFNNAQRMWINPDNGEITYQQEIDAGSQMDFTESIRWSTVGGDVDLGQIYRKMYYSGQLYYAQDFDLHSVTGMGLFSREKYATGGEFPHFREDWVFRATYNYAMKYFFEANGAYNGSEQFGVDYRFDFYPSLSLGWMLSEESFVKNLTFIDMLKFRGSIGRIGNDRLGNARFLYSDQWTFGGNTQLGSPATNTPYTYYRMTQIGNPNIAWETVEKRNIGVDYSFLNGFISGSVDVFSDHRWDILINGGSRAIPSYFGQTAPTANLGIVDTRGYEVELNLEHRLDNGLRLWANSSFTHAVNEVKFRDDPELRPAYRKAVGYAINQTRAYIDHGFIQSWDDLLGSTIRINNNDRKLPGDYNIIDFNGDGVIDDNDQAPYQYTGVPQNTYNATVGFEWKGFSCFAQFYGVTNVTRDVAFPTFLNNSNVVFKEGTFWTVENGGDIPLPRWTATVGGEAAGTQYLYDGSYWRLKNAEVAYTFQGNWINNLGIGSCRIYLNGSNLLLWTSMPDDRESNFSGVGSHGAYPTVKRFNLGLDVTL